MPQTGTIAVMTKFTPLAFILFLCKPIVDIDGTESKVSWGPASFPVSPGRHRVTISFRYIVFRAGKNSIEVNVAEGATVPVNYKAPWVMFLPGKLTSP